MCWLRGKAMRKHEIEREAIAGGRVRGRDVARVSRSRKYITLRHAWPENVDARAWARIMREARELAESVGASEIYDPRGWLIAEVDQTPPCAESMGCLCAFHARGGNAYQPCNASEGK